MNEYGEKQVRNLIKELVSGFNGNSLESIESFLLHINLPMNALVNFRNLLFSGDLYLIYFYELKK